MRADHSTRMLPAGGARRVNRWPRPRRHAWGVRGRRRLHAPVSSQGRARACLHSRAGFERGEWQKRRPTYEWARQDSNLRPTGYEPAALTPELRAPDVILIQVPPSANDLPGLPHRSSSPFRVARSAPSPRACSPWPQSRACLWGAHRSPPPIRLATRKQRVPACAPRTSSRASAGLRSHPHRSRSPPHEHEDIPRARRARGLASRSRIRLGCCHHHSPR